MPPHFALGNEGKAVVAGRRRPPPRPKAGRLDWGFLLHGVFKWSSISKNVRLGELAEYPPDGVKHARFVRLSAQRQVEGRTQPIGVGDGEELVEILRGRTRPAPRDECALASFADKTVF